MEESVNMNGQDCVHQAHFCFEIVREECYFLGDFLLDCRRRYIYSVMCILPLQFIRVILLKKIGCIQMRIFFYTRKSKMNPVY